MGFCSVCENAPALNGLRAGQWSEERIRQLAEAGPGLEVCCSPPWLVTMWRFAVIIVKRNILRHAGGWVQEQPIPAASLSLLSSGTPSQKLLEILPR